MPIMPRMARPLKANLRKANLKSMTSSSRDFVRQARLTKPEIIAFIAVVLFCIFVVYFHISRVRPLSSELDSLEQREQIALNRIRRSNDDKRKAEEEKANAGKIIGSLESFERGLKDRADGTSLIITEINRLANVHDANAGDYAYRLIEADNTQTKSATGATQREDQLKVFAALGVSTSLTGDYAHLRRLIEAIERSPQFIVIDSIAFQGETSSKNVQIVPAGPAAAAQPGVPVQGAPQAGPQTPGRNAPTTGKRNDGSDLQVSLKVEMETFFRRRY